MWFPGVRRAAPGLGQGRRLGRTSNRSCSRSHFCGRSAASSAGGSGAAQHCSSGLRTCSGDASRCQRGWSCAWRPSCYRQCCCCCRRFRCCRSCGGRCRRLGDSAHRAAASAAARSAAAAKAQGVFAGHPLATCEDWRSAPHAHQRTLRPCEHIRTACHRLHHSCGCAGQRQPPQPSQRGKGLGSEQHTDEASSGGWHGGEQCSCDSNWCW